MCFGFFVIVCPGNTSPFDRYFMFLKYCIFLLSLVFFLECYPIMVYNYTGTTCETTSICEDSSSYLLLWSFANQINSIYDETFESWISFWVLVALIVSSQVWMWIMRKMNVQLSEKFQSVSDYTVLIENLPKDFKSYDEIVSRIKNWIENGRTHYKVVRVIPCFNVAKANTLYPQANNAQNANNPNPQEAPEPFYTRWWNKLFNRSQNQNLSEEEKFQQIQTGIALVTFKNQFMREEFMSEYKIHYEFHKSLLAVSNWEWCCFGVYNNHKFEKNPDYKIWSVKPDEPDDIVWENLKVGDFNYYRSIFFQTFVNVVLMGLVFFTLLYIEWKNNKITESPETDATIAQNLFLNGLSIMVSYGIVIFSVFQSFILRITENWIGSKTKSLRSIRLAKWNAVISFLNTSVFPLLTSFIFWSFFGSAGFIVTQTNILRASGIINPFFKFFDVSFFIKEARRFLLKNRTSYNIAMPQQTLEQNIFSYEPFDIGAYLGGNLVMFASGCFFAPIVPLGTLWCLIGLCLNYCVEKYILTKRSSINYHPSGEIVLQVSSSVEIGFILFSVSLIFLKFTFSYELVSLGFY